MRINPKDTKTCGYLRNRNTICFHRTLKLEATSLNDDSAIRLPMNDVAFAKSETGEESDGSSLARRARSSSPTAVSCKAPAPTPSPDGN